ASTRAAHAPPLRGSRDRLRRERTLVGSDLRHGAAPFEAGPLDVVRVAPRILILTASVGEGHDLPARTLADQLRLECPECEVVTEDALVAMGRIVQWMSEDSA